MAPRELPTHSYISLKITLKLEPDPLEKKTRSRSRSRSRLKKKSGASAAKKNCRLPSPGFKPYTEKIKKKKLEFVRFEVGSEYGSRTGSIIPEADPHQNDTDPKL